MPEGTEQESATVRKHRRRLGSGKMGTKALKRPDRTLAFFVMALQGHAVIIELRNTAFLKGTVYIADMYMKCVPVRRHISDSVVPTGPCWHSNSLGCAAQPVPMGPLSTVAVSVTQWSLQGPVGAVRHSLCLCSLTPNPYRALLLSLIHI